MCVSSATHCHFPLVEVRLVTKREESLSYSLSCKGHEWTSINSGMHEGNSLNVEIKMCPSSAGLCFIHD